MQNIPPDRLAEIQNALKKPEGTFFFVYSSPELFDKSHPGGIIFEIVSGKHFYRLERDQDLLLHFFYSSPGTGTRVATIDLKSIEPAEKIKIMISWCPEETQLLAGTSSNLKEAVKAKGAMSEKQFRVGENGFVNQIGDRGVQVEGVRVFQGGIPISQPTALESWRETLKALEVLSTGKSNEGFIYEVVVANLTLSMLATGFETYNKTRFVEIQHEGMEANEGALIRSFLSLRDRTEESLRFLYGEAHEAGYSVAELLVKRRKINFQNYKECKLAYNKAYGIKFGDLNLADGRLTALQKYLNYRHKIIHVSPLLGCLNLNKTPPEEPAIPSSDLAQKARDCFAEVIDRLHQATLALRPIKTT